MFNLFDLFNYRYLKINSHFFLLWLKGSQRWYSGWSDHGFKSGLPLFKPPVGRLEFSIASSHENLTGLVSFIGIFAIVLTGSLARCRCLAGLTLEFLLALSVVLGEFRMESWNRKSSAAITGSFGDKFVFFLSFVRMFFFSFFFRCIQKSRGYRRARPRGKPGRCATHPLAPDRNAFSGLFSLVPDTSSARRLCF